VQLSGHALHLLLAATANGGKSKGGSSIASFLPLVLIVVVGYMLLVRPARARQRKAMQNRAEIEPGVEVTTTAGLIATVVSVDDATVVLEVAPGVHSRYVKGAIARVNSPDIEDDESTTPSGGLDNPGHEDIPAEESTPASSPDSDTDVPPSQTPPPAQL
jgi:preprotein translocase subunit YajC